jgi:hypothetical protein
LCPCSYANHKSSQPFLSPRCPQIIITTLE